MSKVSGRHTIEQAVLRELLGPNDDEAPSGRAVDCSNGSLTFATKQDAEGPFFDQATSQEILTRSDPLRRYGVGILYSGGAPPASSSQIAEDVEVLGLPSNEGVPDSVAPEVAGGASAEAADSDDFDLSDANRRRQAAMAISFKVRIGDASTIALKVSGASYDPVKVSIPDTPPSVWWVRRPFSLYGLANATEMRVDKRRTPLTMTAEDRSPLYPPRRIPSVYLYARPVPGEDDRNLRLLTIAVVNDMPGTGPGSVFFQIGFEVRANDGARIEAYPEIEQPGSDDEESSLSLLYRNQLTFAIGHGCAADWSAPHVDGLEEQSVKYVYAKAVPSHEVVGLTPDIYESGPDGSRKAVRVSMERLSHGDEEGKAQVERVLALYGEWIDQRDEVVKDLSPRYREAARRHIALCREALARMQEGWELARTDEIAARAFQLANHAMLYQQLRSRLPLRDLTMGADKVYRPKGNHPSPTPNARSGWWRPFQIAFILATLPEILNRTHPRRAIVDLIFFPTGGGKTEAYLGAAAVSLISRRLRDPGDVGSDTLMRYTLRLLTAQQFLRASSLICVLEDLRDQLEGELGETPFGIGVWLGGDSTPNTWSAAVESLKLLHRDYTAPNKFLLLRCPWCGTRMRPIRQKKGQDTPGYVVAGKKVALRCVDDLCRFSGKRGLPVHVVDEDIYECRPSIVIGTVDKFATMAWRPEARALFGLGNDGDRVSSPPSLIVQDELHLISGPLGSMVGLYEPVIDDLTTDRREGNAVQSKIIASTATVRRYEEQIEALFGRTEVRLFPPHGIEEGHSFFAEPATLDDGTPAPGRRYVGLLSTSLGSTQSVQVRVAAATLQAAPSIPDEEERDGYWTNLNFFNSLRELGNTVSLLESDIPDYLVGLQRRDGTSPRWPRNTMELTSRRRSDEIPNAIEELEVKLPSQECVDICLASNIIEVGIDIDRLGLMTIVGQPKTTAQYIQVSGRVGRSEDAPGLVLVIYGANKPRDRSHYEHFRTYHQKLYAQVEPTSVTPFSEPVLKRALHAAVISRMRQLAPQLEPYPFPRVAFDASVALIRERAALVDPEELDNFDHWVRERSREWERGQRSYWAATPYFGGNVKEGLMRPAGDLPDPENVGITWDTPMSMRNVDAECRLKITRAYVREDAAGEDQNDFR